MIKKSTKVAFAFIILCFAIQNAFARSPNPHKGIEGAFNGEKNTGRQSDGSSKRRGKTDTKGLTFETHEQPKYLGTIQFDLGYAIGAANYYEDDYYSSSYYNEHRIDAVGMFTFGLENHNLFRITPFKKINIYAGFMESFFYNLGDADIFDFTVGGEVAVKFSKIALVQAAMGLDVGLVLYPVSFLAPAFFFEFQAKFLPNSFFSPLIGMKFTKFSTDDDEDPASVSSNAFYLGGSFNFRSRGKR